LTPGRVSKKRKTEVAALARKYMTDLDRERRLAGRIAEIESKISQGV
jgi:hypothetical protein